MLLILFLASCRTETPASTPESELDTADSRSSGESVPMEEPRDTAPLMESSGGISDSGTPDSRSVDEDGDGYVGAEGGGPDCDDLDAAVNPAAAEVCGDDVDNDCDGAASGCGLDGSVPAGAAATKFVGQVPGDWFGYTSAFVDVNGDGQQDLVVSAYGAEEGGGAVYLFSTRREGNVSAATADARITGGGLGEHLGASLAEIDWDHDGAGDLLLGGHGEPAAIAGKAYLVSGATLTGNQPVADVAAVSFTGENLGDHAGISVRGADFNGDGIDDVAIGAELENTTGPTSGAVYVVYDPQPGASSLADADAKILGAAAYDHAGWRLSSGDFSGDGVEDLAISAPWADDAAGRVYLIESPSGAVSVEDAGASLHGEFEDGRAGMYLAVGDIDVDGFDDFALGTSATYRTDLAYVKYGPIIGTYVLSASEATVLGGGAGVGIADFDGDGFSEIAVGAPEESGVAIGSGVAYLFAGPVVASVTSASGVVQGEATGDYFGWGLSSGNWNEDQTHDLAVSAIFEATAGRDAGAVYIFAGGSGY